MLTQTLENMLNRNLADSPRGRELCAELRGRRLRIVAVGPGWQLDVESLGGSLQLGRAADVEIHATVTGSPLSLLALAGADAEGNSAEVLRRNGVRIEGDAELAHRYRDLLKLLRPDIEEELARVIGDSPAHQLLRLARSALQFGQRATDTTLRNSAEYFAHESRDLVPRAEAEDFYSNVDRLREDVDRLEARILQLRGREATGASEHDHERSELPP